MLAVMGPSGGGKSTLINALSRRGPVSSGRVRYGGVRGESWSPGLKRCVALVDQDDQVLSALTVGETLRFGAALRLSHLPPAERDARIGALIATLRLGACESTRVGDSSSASTRGISGGERKRLCIACELLTLPSLLFCDEPSSGLDSSMAFVVVDVLRELARLHGVTVIASIHQPSSQVHAALHAPDRFAHKPPLKKLPTLTLCLGESERDGLSRVCVQ
jgi:ABC-type multidrug transport system ATPase subunit